MMVMSKKGVFWLLVRRRKHRQDRGSRQLAEAGGAGRKRKAWARARLGPVYLLVLVLVLR
jgi:hypothetical protein